MLRLSTSRAIVALTSGCQLAHKSSFKRMAPGSGEKDAVSKLKVSLLPQGVSSASELSPEARSEYEEAVKAGLSKLQKQIHRNKLARDAADADEAAEKRARRDAQIARAKAERERKDAEKRKKRASQGGPRDTRVVDVIDVDEEELEDVQPQVGEPAAPRTPADTGNTSL